MALGTLFGGWRIVHTMGSQDHPPDAACRASAPRPAGAITLFVATYLGVPVSTTHTITGAIVGVGAARRVSAVRWNVARRHRRGLGRSPCRAGPDRRGVLLRCSGRACLPMKRRDQAGRTAASSSRPCPAASTAGGVRDPADHLARDPPLGDPQGLADQGPEAPRGRRPARPSRRPASSARSTTEPDRLLPLREAPEGRAAPSPSR